MAISSAGLGSNIDVNSLVSQLLALERRPLDRLNQRKTQYNAELSSFGKISSDLSGFQSAVSALKTADSFKVFNATAADTTYLTSSADSTASAGSHSITITQLAKAQKLFSAAFADTSTTTIGTGSLTIANGASSFAVTIDSSNNTLDGIVNAVNAASSNFGVSASIVNDGTGYRLLFSPNNTGTAYAVTVAVSDTGDGNNTDTNGLSRLSYTGGGLNLSQTQTAQNAIITVDGLTGINSASNTVTDVIQGVTLNLKKELVSTTLDVAVDTDTITANATAVVTAYNKLVTNITDLHKKGGQLEADNTLLTIQSQLVGIFNTQATISGNAYSYLAEVGIALQSNGTLAINSADFKSALSGHLNDVVKLFTDTNEGFAQRFYSETTKLLQADGVIDAKNDGIATQISSLDTRIDQFSTRLTLIEARLRRQFSALDSLLGTLSSTSNLLSRQLR
ncbi:MAG: flagellar filament capping protein FliD [Burkholderiales bacterium]|nr:flagellar filament capping protein FliD [Burkholderiales bacterium]